VGPRADRDVVEKKNVLSLPRIKSKFHPVQAVTFAIQTELPRLCLEETLVRIASLWGRDSKPEPSKYKEQIVINRPQRSLGLNVEIRTSQETKMYM
jgi:hypothetical protein